MCLNLTKKDAVKKTASSDIICYKIVKTLQPRTSKISIDIEGFVPCTVAISKYSFPSQIIEGYLYSDINGDYILHDNSDFNGKKPILTDEVEKFMMNFRYSWKIDFKVLSVRVKGKEVLITDSDNYKVIDKKDHYLTYYRDVYVKLGEKYTSELCIHKNESDSKFSYSVEEGLHSFKNLEDTKALKIKYYYNTTIIECVIPKGAVFYEGEFINTRSYASDTLIYKKEIPCV